MREIKFRAWDIQAKEYIDDVMYISNCDQIVIPINGVLDSCIRAMTDKFIVEQYTGLKDKNGVEIYEGDIVTGEYHNLSVDYSKNSSVEWGETYDSDGWSCESTLGWVLDNGSSLLDVVNYKGCEIIGNIHEESE